MITFFHKFIQYWCNNLYILIICTNSEIHYLKYSQKKRLKTVFGQRPQRGQSPVEHRGLSFVHSFVRSSVPSQALSGLKSALSGLKSAFSGLKSAFSGLESALSGLKLALSGLESERADFRPKKAGFRPERADFRPERAWGGGRKNEQTNKSPMCSTGPCPLQGRCPASHSDLQPWKAGQRVSLTMYCPWATCYFMKKRSCPPGIWWSLPSVGHQWLSKSCLAKFFPQGEISERPEGEYIRPKRYWSRI